MIKNRCNARKGISLGWQSYCEASGTELRNCPTYIHEWIARDKEETMVTSKAGPK